MKYFVLASLLCLSACSDDNDNKNNETPQNLAELTVDASEISIAQGDTRTVKITSGNGEYEVTSANEEVVTAEVDGDIVTLTAVEGHNNAQGVVYVKDKYYQRAKILVNTAAEFDLKLNKTLFTLYSQVEGADEAFVKIYTGNGGYSLEVIDDKRYQCQIKRFGIWWNDESFSTKERMLDYARKLEKAGHIVFNYL